MKKARLSTVLPLQNYSPPLHRHGFLMHLTSEELVRHGYVSERDMREKSVAVVRDPFSRLVSVWKCECDLQYTMSRERESVCVCV